MNKKINVLILGSGGREHAIAWHIAKSIKLGKLYVAPGNSGTIKIAQKKLWAIIQILRQN